jgi:hypothetical protein
MYFFSNSYFKYSIFTEFLILSKEEKQVFNHSAIIDDKISCNIFCLLYIDIWKQLSRKLTLHTLISFYKYAKY